jgi:GT2 family glycosyltransferase
MLDYEVIIVNKPDHEPFPTGDLVNTKVIDHPRFGVAEMRNIGIKHARGKYLLMLDADTEILSPVLPALKFMDSTPDAAALGASSTGPDRQLQYSCRTFYDLRTIIFRRTFLGRAFPQHPILKKHLMMEWDHNTARCVDWVQGAFLLMRKTAIDDIGLFDEFSPFGFEDVAWCMRAHRKNWLIYYYPSVRVLHNYRRSSASALNARALQHLMAFMRFVLKFGFPRI